MRKSLSYIFYRVSLAGVSRRRRCGQRPLLLPLQRCWASGQAVGGSWMEIFLLLPMFMSIKRYAPFSCIEY